MFIVPVYWGVGTDTNFSKTGIRNRNLKDLNPTFRLSLMPTLSIQKNKIITFIAKFLQLSLRSYKYQNNKSKGECCSYKNDFSFCKIFPIHFFQKNLPFYSLRFDWVTSQANRLFKRSTFVVKPICFSFSAFFYNIFDFLKEYSFDFLRVSSI